MSTLVIEGPQRVFRPAHEVCHLPPSPSQELRLVKDDLLRGLSLEPKEAIHSRRVCV